MNTITNPNMPCEKKPWQGVVIERNIGNSHGHGSHPNFVVKLVWLRLSWTNYTISESMPNISCKASWYVKLCKEHHLLHPKDDDNDKPNSKEGTGTGRTPMLMLIVLSIHPNAFDIFGLIVLYFVLSTWCNNFHSPCQSHQASWELHQNECKISNNSLLYLIVEATFKQIMHLQLQYGNKSTCELSPRWWCYAWHWHVVVVSCWHVHYHMMTLWHHSHKISQNVKVKECHDTYSP